MDNYSSKPEADLETQLACKQAEISDLEHEIIEIETDIDSRKKQITAEYANRSQAQQAIDLGGNIMQLQKNLIVKKDYLASVVAIAKQLKKQMHKNTCETPGQTPDHTKKIAKWNDKISRMDPNDPKMLIYKFNIKKSEMIIEYQCVKHQINIDKINDKIKEFNTLLRDYKNINPNFNKQNLENKLYKIGGFLNTAYQNIEQSSLNQKLKLLDPTDLHLSNQAISKIQEQIKPIQLWADKMNHAHAGLKALIDADANLSKSSDDTGSVQNALSLDQTKQNPVNQIKKELEYRKNTVNRLKEDRQRLDDWISEESKQIRNLCLKLGLPEPTDADNMDLDLGMDLNQIPVFNRPAPKKTTLYESTAYIPPHRRQGYSSLHYSLGESESSGSDSTESIATIDSEDFWDNNDADSDNLDDIWNMYNDPPVHSDKDYDPVWKDDWEDNWNINDALTIDDVQNTMQIFQNDSKDEQYFSQKLDSLEHQLELLQEELDFMQNNCSDWEKAKLIGKLEDIKENIEKYQTLLLSLF